MYGQIVAEKHIQSVLNSVIAAVDLFNHRKMYICSSEAEKAIALHL